MARSRISSRSDLSPLVSALSRLADRVGEGPVSLSVSLTDSNEVLSLRARIESLEKELDALRASYILCLMFLVLMLFLLILSGLVFLGMILRFLSFPGLML